MMLHRLSNLIGSLLRGRAQRDVVQPHDAAAPRLGDGSLSDRSDGPRMAAPKLEIRPSPARQVETFELPLPQTATSADFEPSASSALAAEEIDHTFPETGTIDPAGDPSQSEPSPAGLSPAEEDPAPQDAWLESIDEYVFHARFQLATPLAALLFHDKRHLSLGDSPPEITPGNRHGQWQPELLQDDAAPETRLAASAVGPIPVDGGDFLPFLIAVRRAIEADETMASRIANLHTVLQADAHTDHVAALGGAEQIERGFFPDFTSSISGLGKGVAKALRERGLCTPAQIMAATDADLLEIKGIGPARLKAIRAACVAANDPDCAFTDAVERPAPIHSYQ